MSEKLLDLATGALAGAWFTVLLLGSALNPELRAEARDGVLICLAVMLLVRLIVERMARSEQANG